MRAYRDLFGHPQVLRLTTIVVMTRFAAPVLSLSLLLAVVHAYHSSFAYGGLAVTAYAAALAVTAPISGRLVDRLRPRPVLFAWLAGNVVAYVGIMVSLAGVAPISILLVCAAAIGATNPPSGPLIRSTWRSVVPAEQLQTAYAMDAAINEAMFVGGPLLVSAALLVTSPVVLIAVVGLCRVVSVALLADTPAIRARGRGVPTRSGHFLGPLAFGQVRLLLTMLLLDTVGFGCMLVAVPAATIALGAPDLAGVLFGLESVGAVITGFVYGTRRRGRRPGRQLAMFHAGSAIALAGIAGAPSLLVLAGLLVVVGLVSGPRDTLHQLVLGDAVADGAQTEAFSWMTSFMWVGYSLGTAVAGQLISHSGGQTDLAFYLAGGVAAAAALLALFVRSAPAPAVASREDVGQDAV